MQLPKTLLTLRPNDLLVYIDETGGESLTDPNYPVFGLGGCAIAGSDYMAGLEQPWKKLKAEHFGGAEVQLHAAEVDLANKAGISAIGQFFSQSPVARFATVFDPNTKIFPADTELYLAMSLILHEQIGRAVREFAFYRFVLVFEDSTRGNILAMRYFSELQPILDGPEGPFRAPVERCFAPKSLAHPGLEAADFILHAAGGQANARFRGKHRMRTDFELVFSPKPGRFAEINFATHVVVTSRAQSTA